MLATKHLRSALSLSFTLTVLGCTSNLDVPKNAQISCFSSDDCPTNLRVCYEGTCVAETPSEQLTITGGVTGELAPTQVQTARSTQGLTAAEQQLLLASDGKTLTVTADRQWRPRPWAGQAPPPADDALTTYDAARGVLVVYLPTTADLWERDSRTAVWTHRQPFGATPSPGRTAPALAYDAALGVVVLFGGGLGRNDQNDLWEWDGTASTWTQVTTKGSSPSPRQNARLVYDSDRGHLVLFGGQSWQADNSLHSLSDIWEWDGASWTQTFDGRSGPTARRDEQVAYQSTCKTFLMFSGAVDTQGIVSDLWEWDPATSQWTQRTSSDKPPAPRMLAGLAHDPVAGQTWLWGGTDTGISATDAAHVFGDVWGWDCRKGTWIQQQRDASWPLPSQAASLVWDPIQKQSLFFGGHFVMPRNDLWAWDGVALHWQDLSPAPQRPGNRWGQAMTFDESTGHVLMFGGQASPMDPKNTYQDLWEWDGSHWSHRPPGAAPEALVGARFVYDSAGKRALLYGGEPAMGFSQYGVSELWQWSSDAGQWTLLWPQQQPSGANPGQRTSPGVAFDPKRNVLVTFGGLGGDNDVWEWSTTQNAWTNRTAGSAGPRPSPRTSPGFVYEPNRGTVVLFGGSDLTGNLPTDLWEWDGKQWKQLPTMGTPPPGRSDFVFLADPQHHRLIVAGGTGSLFSYNDLWTWDEQTGAWSQQPMATPLSARTMVAATDTKRGIAVLFGGKSTNILDDTWELDLGSLGRSWTQVDLAAQSQPPPLANAQLAYDATRQRFLLFGGDDGVSLHDETWEWNPASATWVQYKSRIQPLARIDGTLVADEANARLLLYGGAESPVGDSGQDLWAWDSATHRWTELSDMSAPGPRAEFGAYVDPNLGQLLLFGGATDRDLWSYDLPSSQWTTLSATGATPPMQFPPLMTYDTRRKTGVLFDGNPGPDVAPSTARGGLWTWDGSSAWQSVAKSHDPSGPPNISPFYESLIYDARRDRMVLSSGLTTLWEWSPADEQWQHFSLSMPGMPHANAATAYDSTRGTTVLFGGTDHNSLLANDVWEWDGGSSAKPALLITVTPPVNKPPPPVQMQILAGGRGSEDKDGGSEITGAELLAWRARSGEWVSLATNTAPPESPAALTVQLTSADVVAPFHFGPNRQVILAIASRAPTGRAHDPATVSVDSVQVVPIPGK